MAWGEAWTDSGLVFTYEDGPPLRARQITEHFRLLVHKAGLPPIRLHDLRHGAATLSLAAGVDIKVVQEMLGQFHEQLHSRRVHSPLCPRSRPPQPRPWPRSFPRRASNVPAKG